MYSGMAVRTAIAIGLSNESENATLARKKEARRTWWYVANFHFATIRPFRLQTSPPVTFRPQPTLIIDLRYKESLPDMDEKVYIFS